MARKTLKVKVNPDIIKWARDSSGLDLETIKKKLRVTLETIRAWEDGTRKPTLRTLEMLASLYKRPLATFLLPQPPYEPALPPDFRAVPREQRQVLSSKTRLAIRKARRLQIIVTEMMEQKTVEKPVVTVGKTLLTEDPELVAERERGKLGVSIKDQFKFRSVYDAFNKWRVALENYNIAVLQEQMAPEEVRGFSLLDHLVPTIVISRSDSIRARIFTLFHEYAHLLLGTEGICRPDEASPDNADEEEVEKFCNHFAGAFLVPKQALRADENASLIARVHDLDNSILNQIAARFKVSNQVILRRLLICQLISKKQYQDKLREVQSQVKRAEHPFKMPASKRCISEKGRLFVSLALEAKERDLITYSDLADYLSIDLKHLDKLEATLSLKG